MDAKLQQKVFLIEQILIIGREKFVKQMWKMEILQQNLLTECDVKISKMLNIVNWLINSLTALY